MKAEPRLSLEILIVCSIGFEFLAQNLSSWIGVNVVKVTKTMWKLEVANREIRGWFRKSCLEKTGVRFKHLLPISLEFFHKQ